MANINPRVEAYTNPASRSPRHYDKYTYAVRRKPENEADEIQALSPRSQRLQRNQLSEYETIISGVPPLAPNSDGFCVAEDGSISSRNVAPLRECGPAIAMVSVPVTVVPSRRLAGDNFSETASVMSSVASPVALAGSAPFRRIDSDVDPVPQRETDAWNKLLLVAGHDFSEEELIDLSWELLEQLLVHYGLSDPILVARIQLFWRRRNGALPSEKVAGYDGSTAGADTRSIGSAGSSGSGLGVDGNVYVPAFSLSRPRATTPKKKNLAISSDDATSPRRSDKQFIPGHRTRTDYRHVGPKIDTGRRSAPGTPRNTTPTRSTGRASPASSTPRPRMRF